MNRKRGMLTDEVKKISMDFLGREITQRELRLYPYLQYISVNSGCLEMNRVQDWEIELIDDLEDDGHLIRRGDIVAFSRDFYIFMNEILYSNYVKYRVEDL